MTAEWVGRPDVTLTRDSLTIEQDVRWGLLTTGEWLQVFRYPDGRVTFTDRYQDNGINIPAHWLPIVNEFLVRSEVSA